MHVVVPEPSPDPLRYFKRGGPLVVSLRDGLHATLVWEDLLKDGLDLDSLLASHPASFVTWVRTRRNFGVPTWALMMEAFPTLDACALLSWWGPGLTKNIVNLLKLNTSALEKMGLSTEGAAKLGWSNERWQSLFGCAPDMSESPIPNIRKLSI